MSSLSSPSNSVHLMAPLSSYGENKVDMNPHNREEEIAILAFTWHELKSELKLFKRIMRKLTFRSDKTAKFKRMLSKVENSVAQKLMPIREEIKNEDDFRLIRSFIQTQLSKEKYDFSNVDFTEADLSAFISYLSEVDTVETNVQNSALIKDDVFDAAILKLKTEQNGVLVGPELDTTKTFLGYPLFYVQNFISDAIKGNITWPILRPANSRILKSLWKAIAHKIGISKDGLSSKDIFSMHLQGMKALKHQFGPIEALFKPPYETNDTLLNAFLASKEITPEKLANFKEGVFANGETREEFSKSLRKALTDYFQRITGELIHPEGDDFESLYSFLKAMENHFMMLEECAKFTLENETLFNRFSECLDGQLCFNAKDRALQDFYTSTIFPNIIESFASMTSEKILNQLIADYLQKNTRPTPLALKRMIENGDLTYGVPFQNIVTSDSSVIDFEQMLISVIQQSIDHERLVQPENDDWKKKEENPFEEYVNNLLDQVKGNENYHAASIREMLSNYSRMNKEDILNELTEKLLKDEEGRVKDCGLIEFRQQLTDGSLLFGIPLQKIMAVGRETFTDEDIDQFIEGLVDLCMIEDDR